MTVVLFAGELTPLRLDQKFGLVGRVGQYPVGLPINFSYEQAPPLLYRVKCHKQIVRFGGHPYHTITTSARYSRISVIADLRVNQEPGLGVQLHTASVNEDMDSLLFHPHYSNRLLWKTDHAVDCFRLSAEGGATDLRKLYSMGFFERRVEKRTTSSFGRKLSYRGELGPAGLVESVISMDYAEDLDLFAVLGVFPSRPTRGWVHLYDSETGELVRAVRMREEVCDTHFYQLYVDSASIVVIEKRNAASYAVYVYNM